MIKLHITINEQQVHPKYYEKVKVAKRAADFLSKQLSKHKKNHTIDFEIIEDPK